MMTRPRCDDETGIGRTRIQDRVNLLTSALEIAGRFWLKEDGLDAEPADTAGGFPFERVADAETEHGGADWSEDGDSVAVGVGFFWKDESPLFLFAGLVVEEDGSGIHGDNVGRGLARRNDRGAIEFGGESVNVLLIHRVV